MDECQCTHPRPDYETEWIDRELGECIIIVATVNRDNLKDLVGVAKLPSLQVKASVMADPSMYSEHDVRSMIEAVAYAIKHFYVDTRLRPLFELDDEDAIQ